jgi:FtsP/CotA-like multicopper oxidase with cupredoxin domain
MVEDVVILNGVETPMPKLTANQPPPIGNPMGYGYSMYGVTEVIQLNAVEEWELINTTPDIHPMHLHLVQFQVSSYFNILLTHFIHRVSSELMLVFR